MKKTISAILVIALFMSYIVMLPLKEVQADDSEVVSSMSEQGQNIYDAVDSGKIVIDGVEKTVVDIRINEDEFGGSYSDGAIIQTYFNRINNGTIEATDDTDSEEGEESDNTVVVDPVEDDENETSENTVVVEPGEESDNTVVVDPVEDDENETSENTIVVEPVEESDNTVVVEPVEEDYIYRVIIPAGDYEVSGLTIGSNTILDLREGANIYSSTGHAVYGLDMGEYGYDGAENIIILGGSIHGLPKGTDISSHKVNFSSTCTVRFGHSKNISIVGTYIAENCGGHLLEVGAVKNLLVADCEFTGYADPVDSSSSYSLEAIQLDVIHRNEMNFYNYSPKDDYSVENAEIVNNYFHDLRRGVGSHHAVYGHPYENIKIMDNKFDNILDKAIQIEYCKNATISGNEINNATSGISFYSAFAGAFYLPNDLTDRANAKKNFNNTIESNSIIESNKITLTTRAVSSEKWADKSKYGIRIFGDEFTTSNNKKGYETSSETLPPNGIFYISGVTARNNTISTVNDEKTSNLECCIRIRYAKKCTVEGNDINNAVASGVTSGSGINVLKCNTCNVMNNKVKNTFNGISVTGSKNDKIEKNEVTTSLKNGITVVDGSAIESVSNNKIKGIPGTCISVTQKSTITSIYGNNISGNFTHGISVAEGSTIKGNIKKNTVNGGNKNGIAINKSKVSGGIKQNTITSAKAYGILLTASANVNLICDNNISKTKKYGILVYDKSTCKEFGTNKLSSCANSNKISIAANSKGISLKKNTLTLNKGKSYTLKVAYKAANSKKVTWSTSNKAIATVKNGKITAKKKKGTVTITAYQNGAKSKCKVTVK